MLKPFHIEICQRALGSTFHPEALKIVQAANLAQDHLCGQIGHPEYHFDDNSFNLSYDYMDQQRQIVLDTFLSRNENSSSIIRKDITPAWKAFGRLTHVAQDFYAHSNYIHLWVGTYGSNELPSPEEVEALQPGILHHSELRSGKVYMWDWLAFVPGLHGLAYRILPPDSHTHMNLDSPNQGPLFSYAVEAGVKRTIFEYDQIAKRLDPTNLSRFTGL